MMEAKNMEPSPTLKAIIKTYERAAKEEGLKQGLKRGIKLTTVKFVKNLINRDCSDYFIVEATGLSQTEIETIRKSLNES